MEKVTVAIGICSPWCAIKNGFEDPRSPAAIEKDVYWLADVLEITKAKASSIRQNMFTNQYDRGGLIVTVTLTYRQLGKYSAQRQLNGLIKYWNAPRTLRLTEEN